MRTTLLVGVMVLASAASALAQQQRPLPLAAGDIRLFYAGLGQDPVTANDLSVLPEHLPKRGLGGVAGVHLYPLRGRSIALGLGAELMLARGRAQQKDATTGAPVGLPIEQRLVSLSPQLSLNFGHREGWSDLSAGMGQLSFETFQEEAPAERPPSKSTINMGGGARWFATTHVAFCFDIRFYLTRPQEIVGPFPGRQRSRLMVMSAGIAFK
jgi:hypothetical protein